MCLKYSVQASTIEQDIKLDKSMFDMHSMLILIHIQLSPTDTDDDEQYHTLQLPVQRTTRSILKKQSMGRKAMSASDLKGTFIEDL